MKVFAFHPLNRKRITIEFSNGDIEEIYGEHYRLATEIEIKTYKLKKAFKK
jgi:hypothetical protein